MPGPDSNVSKEEVSLPATEYYAKLRKLQRREWWTWGTSLTVIFLLTAGIASLSVPAIVEEKNTAYGTGVMQAIAGLVFLILLFGCYLTYEKILINRLRLELAERQSHSILWRDLAMVDPLTGLYNRRYAERRLREEISRSERRGYALTLVLFDLDKFKHINDQFGHPAGDAVLKEFGDRLGKAVRVADLAARLGGDEFMLLLTECDASQVPILLKRLEGAEASLDGKTIPIGFSVGWKEYEPGESAPELFSAADRALYRDKESRKRPASAAPAPPAPQPAATPSK
ncbi:MAG TPA: GGDEF domain-containing protein [Candidatus Acidoferrales bacterium]|nr:GGDEF domain-containing protein [Candidatus Acidoferrales bacterium]